MCGGGGGHSLLKCGRDAPIKGVLFLESVCVSSLKSWTGIQIYLFGKGFMPGCVCVCVCVGGGGGYSQFIIIRF